jgi:hypothetical protein
MSNKKQKITKYQTGEEIVISREKLKNAPYNPRKITGAARKKLKKNIKEVGLIGSCVVWNKKTGNIVSGHQRIDALDMCEGRSDYDVKVTVVDMDEKQEKEQNVFMNNTEAQGDFDLEILEDIFSDVDIENMGFAEEDKFRLFGFDSEDTEDAVKAAEALQQSRDLFDKMKKSSAERDNNDFYCVLVFKDNKGRRQLADRLNVGDHRYFNGETVLKLLNEVGDT